VLLEQILRRQEEFVQSLKAGAMAELTKKLIMVGVPVPGDLHERMKKYLAQVKGRKGAPTTLKELTVLCVRTALDILENRGTGEDDSVIAELSQELRSCGAKDFSISMEDKTLVVYVPKSACIAPKTVPSNFWGYTVTLQEREEKRA
jgi:hypothetical protein